MQVSVLIPIFGRSTRIGHQPDHFTAARTSPKREDDQRLHWSSAWWSPPPESNRRPHPYHGTTRNRCANRRFPRSRPTVGAEVIGSPSVKLCAHPHATCGRLRPVPRAVLSRRRPRVKPSLAGWARLPVIAMMVASVWAMIAATGRSQATRERVAYLPDVLASRSGCSLRTE
jgi:hypothetical protein